MCLHAAFGPSVAIVGLSVGLWRTLKRIMRHCSTAVNERRGHGFFEVNIQAVQCVCNMLTGQHSFSPMRLLRTFPALEAVHVIGIAVTLVRDLPPELYDELVKHPFEVRNSMEA